MSDAASQGDVTEPFYGEPDGKQTVEIIIDASIIITIAITITIILITTLKRQNIIVIQCSSSTGQDHHCRRHYRHLHLCCLSPPC